MKANQSPWLAASLLALFSVAVTAVPEADAQPVRDRGGYHQSDPVMLERFVMSVDGLRPGDVVRYRVRGTPASTVWVDIRGVGVSLPMTEIRPGLYVAEYQIRPRDDRRVFDDAVAHLQNGPARVNARLQGRSDDRYGRNDHR